MKGSLEIAAHETMLQISMKSNVLNIVPNGSALTIRMSKEAFRLQQRCSIVVFNYPKLNPKDFEDLV
ncbi:MAG: hypothetical protein Mars2KO_45710 [Maribacter sp.]